MTKKKLCLITTNLYVVKFFLQPHLKTLSELYDITLILNSIDRNIAQQIDFSGAKLISLPIKREINLLSDLGNLLALIYLFFKIKPDTVQSIAPKAGILAMLSSWLLRIPVRLHIFQGEVWSNKTGYFRWLLKFIDKCTAFLATHLIVVSQSEKEFLAEQKVVGLSKMRVLGKGSISGVNLEQFKPNHILRDATRTELGISSDQHFIIYLGRLNEDKGILDLVLACSKLKAKDQLRLLIIGPDEHELTKKIDRLSNLHNLNTTLLPYVPNPEKYLCASDLLVLPSYREGFGVVLIEAAACGIATIGSDIYGIRDAINHEETGLLFPPGDIEELSKKIEYLITHQDFRNKLGQQARKRVEDFFSQDKVMYEYLKLHQDLLGEV